MPPLSLPTLRGYVLEEILARLIQNTGYRLLVDESQDREELRNLPHGLAIRGRGGDHQVDVLGELAWIPAFTFPLRLIVEAKARVSKSGIDDVRNAVGVVTDVNENFSRVMLPHAVRLQKFAYRYALFSTSGFSAPATVYTVAHQISLVDLSTQDFSDVVQLADDVARVIWSPDPPSRAGGYIRRLRARLRIALGTWPDDAPFREPDEPANEGRTPWHDVESLLREGVESIGELFVAMANGPYLLVLRARNPQGVIELLDEGPVRDVAIRWSSELKDGTRWELTIPGAPPGAQLSFTLPEPVADWIFDENADARRRAAQFKDRFLSTITIYRYVDGRDRLYRLQFSREQVSFAQERRKRQGR